MGTMGVTGGGITFIVGDPDRVTRGDPEASSTLPLGQRVNLIEPVTIFPMSRALNPAHGGQVCSTWGTFHYKTFDGAIFRFPGLCNYVLAAHCRAPYEDFNVQIRRALGPGGRPVVSRVLLHIDGVVLEMVNGSVLVDGQREQTPFTLSGIAVEKNSVYTKVRAKIGLTFMWNGEDGVLLELDPRYVNQTCGLCGDFNGLPEYNEFYSNDVRLTALQFGNLQKMDGPTEECEDPVMPKEEKCQDKGDVCVRVLTGPAFADCHGLVNVSRYIEACIQDLCSCSVPDGPSCPCDTVAEYSRQCAHAGGRPRAWRNPQLCPKKCPPTMRYEECGSPCPDSCSNPERSQLCEDHCMDGCFCPPGTVLDDVHEAGCIPLSQCSCTFNGRSYHPGSSFSTRCSACTCTGGRWSCQALPCPGTCSVEGGSHVSTFDEKRYTVHGDCTYVLAKNCDDSSFTVLGELRKCGLTDSETCLKTVTLNLQGGQTVIKVQSDGSVYVNTIYTQLPFSAANMTIFQPSTFFVMVQTGFRLQLQIQVVPVMQVFMTLDSSHQGQMCGLCGNFNQNQADDFKAVSGVVEATAAAFANTWKTQADCPNVQNLFENPCALSVDNENYAQHWCSLLTNSSGVFAPCHQAVNPVPYYTNCMFDTCNCEKSEDCLCAAWSSYVRACAGRGVLLRGWRGHGVCAKYATSCPKSLTYSYAIESCPPTCRALSQQDVTCAVSFVPVDGCTCANGTYLDAGGQCVPAASCPCYHHGAPVPAGQSFRQNGAICSCSGGKLSCIGETNRSPVCSPPMVYLDCGNVSAGTPGVECLKSCQTLDMACYSTRCVSGCVCPGGLVSDGKGGCIAPEVCPCVHNEASYSPGETVRVDCNTCTCKDRVWECTQEACMGTCSVYGDGHYVTFDGESYTFEGSCEYTLAQDHCGGNGSAPGSFRVITENVPCGTTGVTCSKAIKVFLGGYELILSEGDIAVVQRGAGGSIPYSVRTMGIFLTIEAQNGLALLWDRKTSIFIRLSQELKGRVCGLCGNFDDHGGNDLTTRSGSVVGDVREFGNSWKSSPSCPDAVTPRDPCTANPYRRAWAHRRCAILHSDVFALCHRQVEPSRFYEACVSDACACDSGGDCECFCTAVAAYARACNQVGVCVSWRTPDICPLFCDYYNPKGGCEWHYQPCGAACMKTCRNPTGKCLNALPGLEGCYPNCPAERPFFSEHEMKCVSQCGCYDSEGNYHQLGVEVRAPQNCQRCQCTPEGIECWPDQMACTCEYEGKTYQVGELIYHTSDGTGGCLTAVCSPGGRIDRTSEACTHAPSTTPFSFSTPTTPQPTTGPTSPPTIPTVCVRESCQWSAWLDGSHPGAVSDDGGEFESLEELRERGFPICRAPRAVECRLAEFPDTEPGAKGQQVLCTLTEGLQCWHRDQGPPGCLNYEIRVLCCSYVSCETSVSPGVRPTPSTTAPPTASLSTKEMATRRETTLQSTPASGSPGTMMSAGTSHTVAPLTLPEAATTTLRAGPGITSAVLSPTSPLGSTSGGWPTSPSGASTGTPTTTAGSTPCHPGCQWTEWFDVDFPSSGVTGGDFETYDSIRAAGGKLCLTPVKVECRAENYPGVSIDQIGQHVQCSLERGLICRNEDQPGKFNLCYNYNIRALCCDDYSHCPGGPPGATTAETPAATTTQPTSGRPMETVRSTAPSTGKVSLTATTAHLLRSTQAKGTATTQRITSAGGPSSPGRTRTSPGTPGTGSTFGTTSMAPARTTTTVSVTEALTTTACRPACRWTEWFDVDHPKPGASGGDVETYQSIRATGRSFCGRPQDVQCRAERYPDMTVDQVGQAVYCDVAFGLVCRNREQTGKSKLCYNYQVRVLCCDDFSHCPPTATISPSPTATTRTPTTGAPSPPTTIILPWSSLPSESTTATHETVSEPVRSTTQLITVPPQTLPTSQTTNGPATTAPQGWTPPGTPSEPATTTASTTALPTTRSTPPASAPIKDHTSPTPTSCQPACHWTEWLDTDYPQSGPDGADIETLDNMRASGRHLCKAPTTIECRAENYPDLPIRDVGQKVLCDVNVGLVCRNHEQASPFKLCFNYHVRFQCCDDYSHCPTWTPSVSASTTTSHRTASSVPSAPLSPTTGATTESPPAPVGTTLKVTPSLHPTSPWPGTTTTATVANLFPNSPGKGTTTTHKVTSTEGPSSPGRTRTSPGTPGTGSTFGTTSTAPATTTTTVSVTEALTTTACRPACRWTEWFDVDRPNPGEGGGDVETYQAIRAAGQSFCGRPQDVQCRAERYPDMTVDEVGQAVYCDVAFGLVCRNREQTGKSKLCYNYQVRVLCCDDFSHCPPTATMSPSPTATTRTPTTGAPSPPTTTILPWSSLPSESTTATHETVSEPVRSTTQLITVPPQTLPTSQTTSGPATTTPQGWTRPGTPSEPATTTASTTALPTTRSTPPASAPIKDHTSPTPTSCQPACHWTEWLDTDYPQSGPDGADIETLDNMRASGRQLCKAPTAIECRAENYPDLPIRDVGQKVLCDVNVGLVCRNREQAGPFKLCFNYHVRFQCCDDYSHCPTWTPSVSASTTTGHRTASSVPSAPLSPTTGATTESPPAPVGTTPKVTPSLHPTSPWPGTTTTATVANLFPNSPGTGTTTTHKVTSTEGPSSPGRTRTSPGTPGTGSTFGTTSTAPATTTTTVSVTEALTTTACQPACRWTEWFDADRPNPGASGGDVETYQSIRATGRSFCGRPRDVQCRAERYPNMTVDQVGQAVYCDVAFGLVCRNREQTGKSKLCYNYQVRVLCCDDFSHCPPTATISPSPTTITRTPPTGAPSLPTTTILPWSSHPSESTTATSETTTSETAPGPGRTTTRLTTVPPQTLPTSQTTSGPATTAPQGWTQPGTPSEPAMTTASTTALPTTRSTPPASAPIKDHTSPTPTSCQPTCHWTDWLDTDYPHSGPDGADIETLDNMRASGRQICKAPTAIECRTENYPNLPIRDVGQNVLCDVNVGLVCRNREQTGPFKLCFNYHVRFQCCDDYSHCSTWTPSVPASTATGLPTPSSMPSAPPFPTTAATTESSTAPAWTTPKVTPTGPHPGTTTKTTVINLLPYSPATGTSPVATTHHVTSTEGPSSPGRTRTSPGTPGTGSTFGTTSAAPATTTTTTTSVTEALTPTSCQPACRWTEWFDVDRPKPGARGGDVETYRSIRDAGHSFCGQPEELECRAERYPDVPVHQVGQTVYCDVAFGLVCRNREQTGKSKLCYNYQVRMLCCNHFSHCPPTTTMSPSPTATPRTPVTGTPSLPTTAILPWSTLPSESTTATSETSLGPVRTTTRLTAVPPQTSPTSQTTSGPATTAPQGWTRPGTASEPASTTASITALPTTRSTPPASAPVKVHTSPTPTSCQPACHWTDWLDTDYPQSGPDGADIETLDNMQASGRQICKNPVAIECRAENYPDLPIRDVGQDVLCDVNVGLVCRNREQTGPFKLCFNYHVRFQCCEDYSHCPTWTPSVPASTTTGLRTASSAPSTPPSPTTAATTESPTAPAGTTPKVTPTGPQPGTTTKATVTNLLPNSPATGTSSTATTHRVSSTEGPSSPSRTRTSPRTPGTGSSFGTTSTAPATTTTTSLSPTATIWTPASGSPSLPTTAILPWSSFPSETTTATSKNISEPVRTTTLLTTVPPQTLPTSQTTGGPETTAPQGWTRPGTRSEPATTAASNTALSTTRSIPLASAPVISPTSPTPSSCQPACHWMEWLDMDYPQSGPDGADIETFDKMWASGRLICKNPVAIECRAENYPDLPIRDVGQNVLCDVKVGLVCRNREQAGPFKLCFNYHVRFQCCDDYSHCPTRTPSVPASTATGLPTPSSAPSTPPSPTTAGTTESPTSPAGVTPKVTPTGPHSPAAPRSSPAPSPSTACRPRCRWSPWFDEDRPESGPDGSDVETYDRLRAAGHHVCREPQGVECRGEDFPGLPVHELGQNVTCDLAYGLVCRNRNQPGPSAVCLNYQIRILCCEDTGHCPTSASPTVTVPTFTSVEGAAIITTPLAASSGRSTTVLLPTWPSTPAITPPSSPLTTPCFCRVFGDLFSPGDVVYNQTDKAGCVYYALCDLRCEIDRFRGPCPTSTPSVSPSSGTPPPSCSNANPPRQINETWTLDNCTVAICEGDNRIVLLDPVPVSKISCENGIEPIKVYHEDRCSYHYECECICNGWGNSHYLTFDGIYYTFYDNCTYVLVREIAPRAGNLSVAIDNHFCEVGNNESCPRALILNYRHNEILLTSEIVAGKITNKVLFNKVKVSQGFSQDGIIISRSSQMMGVEIPEIQASFFFNGLVFQIKLPYGLFRNNTEGQCGTCTNDQEDECRLPGGEISTTCSSMAPAWLVPDRNREFCQAPPTPIPGMEPTPTPAEPCKPAPVCQLILSEVFAGCHQLVPPQAFYDTCVADSCHPSNNLLPCQSTELYASLCRGKGVCSQWRSLTGGQCEMTCPPGKVYEPCGPARPPSCDNRHDVDPQAPLMEGCFCPEGQLLFNSQVDICVPSCPCVGPDGLPRYPGARWESDCQQCECDAGSVTVQCRPIQCGTPEPPAACRKPGFVPVPVLRPEDKCCPDHKCFCDPALCSATPPECGPGAEPQPVLLQGDCCPAFECKRQQCEHNGTLYGIGVTVTSVVPCHRCTCREEPDPRTHDFWWCEPETCDTACPKGFTYRAEAGSCCGRCVQTACQTKDGKWIEVNQSWVDTKVDNCTEYLCEQVDDVFLLSPGRQGCPDVTHCQGRLQKVGCCYECRNDTELCQVRVKETVLTHNGCRTEVPVNLTFCEGTCHTSSIYSAEASAMERRCGCCQEEVTRPRAVGLLCPGGARLRLSYGHADPGPNRPPAARAPASCSLRLALPLGPQDALPRGPRTVLRLKWAPCKADLPLHPLGAQYSPQLVLSTPSCAQKVLRTTSCPHRALSTAPSSVRVLAGIRYSPLQLVGTE
ncbi:mucin-5B-like [Tachyglossus aculeatus]|uniref:mucin-5B-like n=1 Tax=Tachyglossus aculeatus TaxID=9261 RepID=UPI0018F6E89B|nr:mucin-5B-like [Tachyglossus aculeatus]